MNAPDLRICDAVSDVLARAGLDVRHLKINAIDGRLILNGTLPSVEQQEALMDLLRARLDGVSSIEYDVGLQDVGLRKAALHLSQWRTDCTL